MMMMMMVMMVMVMVMMVMVTMEVHVCLHVPRGGSPGSGVIHQAGSQKCCKNLANTRLDPPHTIGGPYHLGGGGGVRRPDSFIH